MRDSLVQRPGRTATVAALIAAAVASGYSAGVSLGGGERMATTTRQSALPAPTTKYDGTYELDSATASGSGLPTTYRDPAYIHILDGRISTKDHAFLPTSTVDAKGHVLAYTVCPQSPTVPGYGARWTGVFKTKSLAQGTYACTDHGVPWSRSIKWTFRR